MAAAEALLYGGNLVSQVHGNVDNGAFMHCRQALMHRARMHCRALYGEL
jgi:hypothetical protein